MLREVGHLEVFVQPDARDAPWEVRLAPRLRLTPEGVEEIPSARCPQAGDEQLPVATDWLVRPLVSDNRMLGSGQFPKRTFLGVYFNKVGAQNGTPAEACELCLKP